MQINSSVKNYNNRQTIKDLLFEKVLDSQFTYHDYKNKPWIRINPEFHNIIVRDINDKSYPNNGQWLKMETFDLKKDGIEFIGHLSKIGFDLYFDNDYNWDIFLSEDKIKKGEYCYSPEI